MSPFDTLCPDSGCGHAPCAEQQRLAIEVERLTAEVERLTALATRPCVHCGEDIAPESAGLVHAWSGSRACDDPTAGFTTEAA